MRSFLWGDITDIRVFGATFVQLLCNPFITDFWYTFGTLLGYPLKI